MLATNAGTSLIFMGLMMVSQTTASDGGGSQLMGGSLVAVTVVAVMAVLVAPAPAVTGDPSLVETTGGSSTEESGR